MRLPVLHSLVPHFRTHYRSRRVTAHCLALAYKPHCVISLKILKSIIPKAASLGVKTLKSHSDNDTYNLDEKILKSLATVRDPFSSDNQSGFNDHYWVS